MKSAIEWTRQTWNPATGCTKISPGCKHCYAEVMARRLHAMGAPGYENEFRLTLHPDRLEKPLACKKPTMFFVNSMSDLFHEAVPDKFLDRRRGKAQQEGKWPLLPRPHMGCLSCCSDGTW